MFEEQFPETRATLLDGGKATEEALRQRAGKYRYVHLATHGYFAPPELRSALGPSDPAARPRTDLFGAGGVAGFHPGLLSGLALAGANVRPTPIGKDDGILTALEVAELDLAKVELAVLSACETGLGDVAGGEGLLGLQRAFQVAGAKSVVASLWTVDDETNAGPDDPVLRAPLAKGASAPRGRRSSRARSAQLEKVRVGNQRHLGSIDEPRKTGHEPYYWAAFVLSTDRL